MNSSMKKLEDYVAFYEASEEMLKNKLAAAIKHNTGLSQLVDDVRAKVIKLQDRLVARNIVIRSIVECSCAFHGFSLRCLV